MTVTATGTPTTVLSSGRQMSVSGTGVRFQTTAGGTITALTAWASSTAYTLATRRTNGGNAYQVITAGTSAGSGGPTGTGSDITDGTVHWQYLGAGTGAVDIAAESVDTGSKVANAGTLTVIETPVAGWSSVTNLLDADLGSDAETDAALRIRRELELHDLGFSALEAVQAHVSKVAGVTAVRVFENTTSAVDSDGLPAKSFECLVEGGDDAEVATAILESKPLGIETHGNTSEVVTDSMSVGRTIEFSRPEEKDIWVIVNLTVDPQAFPADGATQVEDAIVTWGDAFVTGKDVVASAVAAQAFSVDGVLDVTSVLIGLANPPVASTTIVNTVRERAIFDTSRIALNLTTGTP